MNVIDNNIITIPKLLRAMAKGEQAIANKHDIILNEAARLIEHLAEIIETITKEIGK